MKALKINVRIKNKVILLAIPVKEANPDSACTNKSYAFLSLNSFDAVPYPLKEY